MVPQTALMASVLMGFLSILGLLVFPAVQKPVADMYLEPLAGSLIPDSTMVVRVRAHASVPVNVFKADISFDPSILTVDSIEYNTSIANLWAVKPWYANGEGTINFIGGTTIPGGFMGTGDIITITFRGESIGNSSVKIHDAHILAHDGLGTETTLEEPIDALFSVNADREVADTVAMPESKTIEVVVVEEMPTTDLNNDGAQTIADVRIFMLNFFTYDARFDFNSDGKVDSTDLRILMDA